MFGYLGVCERLFSGALLEILRAVSDLLWREAIIGGNRNGSQNGNQKRRKREEVRSVQENR